MRNRNIRAFILSEKSAASGDADVLTLSEHRKVAIVQRCSRVNRGDVVKLVADRFVAVEDARAVDRRCASSAIAIMQRGEDQDRIKVSGRL